MAVNEGYASFMHACETKLEKPMSIVWHHFTCLWRSWCGFEMLVKMGMSPLHVYLTLTEPLQWSRMWASQTLNCPLTKSYTDHISTQNGYLGLISWVTFSSERFCQEQVCEGLQDLCRFIIILSNWFDLGTISNKVMVMVKQYQILNVICYVNSLLLV